MAIRKTTKAGVETPTETKARKPSTKKAEKLAAAAPTHEAISQLAEKYWHEQGRPHGTAEQDWLRAERELMGKAS